MVLRLVRTLHAVLSLPLCVYRVCLSLHMLTCYGVKSPTYCVHLNPAVIWQSLKVLQQEKHYRLLYKIPLCLSIIGLNAIIITNFLKLIGILVYCGVIGCTQMQHRTLCANVCVWERENKEREAEWVSEKITIIIIQQLCKQKVHSAANSSCCFQHKTWRNDFSVRISTFWTFSAQYCNTT